MIYGSWDISAKASWISCRLVNMNPTQCRLWLKTWSWSGLRIGGGGGEPAVGPSAWVVGEWGTSGTYSWGPAFGPGICGSIQRELL